MYTRAFPSLPIFADPPVDPVVAERRATFEKTLREKLYGAPSTAARNTPTPELEAEQLGQQLFRDYGRDWPKIIALASGAAMRAERVALGEGKE